MKGGLSLRILAWGAALALLALPLVGLFMGWFASSHWPVRSVRLQGTFQHVPMATVKQAVAPLVADGFFALDPQAIQRRVARLPWVARVEVRRHWPDQLRILVIEQQAFAQWNANAYINRRGAVFVVPEAVSDTDLPRLGGPPGSAARVVGLYLDARRQFAAIGLNLAGLKLAPRGAWTARLASGATVMIGKQDPRRRLGRFIAGLAQLPRRPLAAFVSADLRYSNGFALRWPQPQATMGGPPRT